MWSEDANPEISRTLDNASSYFGLGVIEGQTRIGGEANKNYVVKTPSGKFVLKVILEHPIEDVVAEVAFLKRLKESDFPSSSYVTSQEGSAIYQDQGQVVLALPKLEGYDQTRKLSEDELKNLPDAIRFAGLTQCAWRLL